jgi:type IV pilus assembly protein PilW
MGKSKITAGFTIVELLISMSLGMIILFAVYNIFTIHNIHFKTQASNLEMIQNASYGLESVSREINIAGFNPTGTLPRCQGTNTATNTPCTGLTSITSSAVSYSADLNGNGDLTTGSANPDENITFEVYTEGGVTYLGRTANGSIQPVVENISALSFLYYDGSDQATSNLSLIRKIRVSITARAATPAANNVYRTITLSRDIVPKNLTD